MAAERVSGHCASLYHPNNSISLRESIRFQTTPTGFGCGQICQGFMPVAAKHRIIHFLLALSFISFTNFPFPISPFLLQWNEATDRQMGRWGSTAFPRPKANWEGLEKDLASLNGPDMMGKSMCTSSVFASRWIEGPQPNVVSAGSHEEFCLNSDLSIWQPRSRLKWGWLSCAWIREVA